MPRALYWSLAVQIDRHATLFDYRITCEGGPRESMEVIWNVEMEIGDIHRVWETKNDGAGAGGARGLEVLKAREVAYGREELGCGEMFGGGGKDEK
ncbi:MAG: hypothetical protein Q9224_004702 [Gallowayella concinna]